MNNQTSTGCWEWCETYQQFKEEGRVREKDLCPACPIRDFHAIWKPLAGENIVTSPLGTGKEWHCGMRCDLCDFKDLTRFEEPCYSCNETLRRRMMTQNQIRIVEERGV